MLNKIEELRLIAKEAAIGARSKLDEPTVHIIWLRDGRISLTLYAPSLALTDGKKNHEYILASSTDLEIQLDKLITEAKSETYKK